MRSGEEGRGDRGGMMKRLYEASLNGSLSSLIQLIEEDELILDRVIITCFNETPLHIAAMLGHVEFAREILIRKPELATELDSESSSPLHLASAKGNLEMVKELLNINPSVCCFTDRNGRIPLHLAAIKGQTDVMRELIQARPEVIHVRLDRGESILHLCVKYSRLEALQLLFEVVASDQQELILNSKDDDGNTVLHLATAKKHTEVIKLLVGKNVVEINAINNFDLTALDILAQSPRDMKDLDIGDSLRAAGALKSSDLILSAMPKTTTCESTSRNRSRGMQMQSVDPDQEGKWLEGKTNSLMVVSTVIATMAFQGALSPPKSDLKNPFYLFQHKRFLISNTVSLVGSLSITLLLISGLPLKRKCFVWILMVSMWVIIIASVSAYFASIIPLIPNFTGFESNVITRVLNVLGFGWLGVVELVLLYHTFRWVLRCVNGLPLIPRIFMWVVILSSIITLSVFIFRSTGQGVLIWYVLICIWCGMAVPTLLLQIARFIFWCMSKLCRRTLIDQAALGLRGMMKIMNAGNQSSAVTV